MREFKIEFPKINQSYAYMDLKYNKKGNIVQFIAGQYSISPPRQLIKSLQ